MIITARDKSLKYTETKTNKLPPQSQNCHELSPAHRAKHNDLIATYELR